MSFIFLRKNFKNPIFYYFLLVFFAILFPLIHYPTIYGKDAFQVIWMANALQDGALFSENSWLIHPLSYFGYYPFSHRAIGVPIFLAFIMTVLNFISFGIFGISESILVLDIILILVIYKSARNLGNTLFEEEWSRFIFVATILFSQIVLDAVTMTVSTRIIIIIIMLILLNLNLKLINNSIKKRKAILSMTLLILIGALSHKLWIATIITIIFSIFLFIIRKSRNLMKISIFLILPVSVIAFFLGLEIIGTLDFDFLTRLDPNQSFSPYIDESSLIGINILVGWFYIWNTSLILIFFPIGVIIILYQLAISVKDFEGRDSHIEKKRQQLQKYYLILFIIPFAFLLPATFYSIVIFFPLLIILSIYGLIQIKKILSAYSESISWLFLGGLVIFSIFYSFLKVGLSSEINLWYIFTLPLIAFFLILFVLVFHKLRGKIHLLISLESKKIKNRIKIIILMISIFIFSFTSIQTNRMGMCSSENPLELACISDEEIDIIQFFQKENIKNDLSDGFIFVTDGTLSKRIAAIGYLPAFANGLIAGTFIGINLWYNQIDPNEVIQNTYFSFSLSKLLNQDFFEYSPEEAIYYYQLFPLEVLRRKIIKLNITIQSDRELLLYEFNVRYIISVKNNLDHVANEWLLIQSLYQSDIEPIFTTTNLLVWKIPI